MLLEHIRFKKRKALKIEIKSKNDIGQALHKLGLEYNRLAIVIVDEAVSVFKKTGGTNHPGLQKLLHSSRVISHL